MNKDLKESITLIALSVSLVIVFIAALGYAIEVYPYRSKFEVNDCVKITRGGEFDRTTYYFKILKVGEKEYLASIGLGEGTRRTDARGELKLRMNKLGKKVDGKNCNVGIVVNE